MNPDLKILKKCKNQFKYWTVLLPIRNSDNYLGINVHNEVIYIITSLTSCSTSYIHKIVELIAH